MDLDNGQTIFNAISEMRPQIYCYCSWNTIYTQTVTLEDPKSFRQRVNRLLGTEFLKAVSHSEKKCTLPFVKKKKFHFRVHKRADHLNLFCASTIQSHITQYSLYSFILPRSPAVYVVCPCLAQYSTWDFFGIWVGFIESDEDFLGYVWIFILLTLSFCLWSPVNCFRN